MKMARALTVLLVVSLLIIAVEAQQSYYSGAKCKPISIPSCQKALQQHNKMVNKTLLTVADVDQSYVSNILNDLRTLINMQCAPNLEVFVCMRFLPVCTLLPGGDESNSNAGSLMPQAPNIAVVKLCRKTCETVRGTCVHEIQQKLGRDLSFLWPTVLRCEDPANFEPDRETAQDNNGVQTLCSGSLPDDPTWTGPINLPQVPSSRSPPGHTASPNLLDSPTQGSRLCNCASSSCLVPLVTSTKDSSWPLGPSNGTCAPRCSSDFLFKAADKKFARIWTLVWSVLCCFSSLTVVLTFLINTRRFSYPERPIVFLAFCLFMYSVGFIVAIAAGRENISCYRPSATAKDSSMNSVFIMREGHDKFGCVIVFMILYYFGLAASLWWAMLSLAWFLAAAKKWSAEAIERASQWFHLAAWALPAIATIVVIIMKAIAADELTGVCFVGGSRSTQLYFVVVPQAVLLVLGILLTVAGFVSLVHIRRRLKRNDTMNIRRLEKLMAKVGIFSVLYAVPTASVLCCLLYEFQSYDQWMEHAWKRACTDSTQRYAKKLSEKQLASSGLGADRLSNENTEQNRCNLDKSVSVTEVFVLKVFMQLVVGITIGMWVWSKKTLAAWQIKFSSPGSNYQKSLTAGGAAAMPFLPAAGMAASGEPVHGQMPGNSYVSVPGNSYLSVPATYCSPHSAGVTAGAAAIPFSDASHWTAVSAAGHTSRQGPVQPMMTTHGRPQTVISQSAYGPSRPPHTSSSAAMRL